MMDMNMDEQVKIKTLTGHAPVQAEGTICGKRFHFRARWSGWCLSVAEDESVDPIDINTSEQGFYVEGDYGRKGGYEASYMPDEDAKAIIERCAQAFISKSQTTV
ncbi:MAG TPA: hypothetical protein VF719_05190 [Abditibacteriaceae bacterium]|jgi:hypothetical protein